MSSKPWREIEMKIICEQCASQNLKSKVFPGGVTNTLMYFKPYYDEEGNYHHHDTNKVKMFFSCSNLHKWDKTLVNECPNENCDWKDK